MFDSIQAPFALHWEISKGLTTYTLSVFITHKTYLGETFDSVSMVGCYMEVWGLDRFVDDRKVMLRTRGLNVSTRIE